MKFVRSCILLVLLQTSLGSVLVRDATTFYNDLVGTDTAFSSCASECSMLLNPATSSQVIRLLQCLNQVSADLKRGFDDCQATNPSSVTADEAQKIVSYCRSPLEPDFKNDLACLIGAKVKLANVKSSIMTGISQMASNTSQLANCLLSRTPATPTSLKAAASTCVSMLNSDFRTALAAYA